MNVDSGPTMFARYAYPPNARGLCGPADHRALLEYAGAGVVDGGLRALAHGFEGAWPYLELIAGANGIDDPLDGRVVEGYWLGNRLTSKVRATDLARLTDARFRQRAGRNVESIEQAVACGLPPTHGFHVFAVYPWTGLLREGRDQPALHVLDQCRISWGEVLEIDGDFAAVRSPRLQRGATGLELGTPTALRARIALDGSALVGVLRPGEHVSLHWDWVCDRLTDRQLRRLRAATAACLPVVNHFLTDGAAGHEPSFSAPSSLRVNALDSAR